MLSFCGATKRLQRLSVTYNEILVIVPGVWFLNCLDIGSLLGLSFLADGRGSGENVCGLKRQQPIDVILTLSKEDLKGG